MILEIDKLKVNTDYLGGFHSEKSASRKYIYTITNDDDKDFKEIVYGELHTPKRKNGSWGEGKMTYYFDSKSPMFDTMIDLLKSKYELTEPIKKNNQ